MTSKTKIAHAKQKNQFRFWAIKLLTMAFVAFPILFLFFSFPLSLYISLCSFSSFWSSILLSLNFYRFIIIANTHGEHTHAPFILTQKHVESTKIRILYLLDFRLKQYAIVLYVCLSYPFWFRKQKITRKNEKLVFLSFDAGIDVLCSVANSSQHVTLTEFSGLTFQYVSIVLFTSFKHRIYSFAALHVKFTSKLYKS